jgi:hypothetical protein
MLPKFTGSTNNLSLQSITFNGTPVTFSIQTIKGYQYAFFNGATGNYVATYAAFSCVTPPTATLAVVPSSSCLNSSVSLQLSAATGTSPYSVVVNGTTYDNVTVGAPFTSFKTNEVSLWNAPPVFTIPNASDGLSPVELGMKFRSSVAGYVTGVQFYKGELNTGSQVGKLYTKAGVLLASVTFTNANDASVGWKQARFSQPVYIQPNTTYVVTFYTPSSYFAYSDFFFTSAFTNGPLTALKDGTDGPNGLGGYGSGFPDQSFQSRNYWVDVLFIPDINTNQTINYTLTGITDLNGCNNTGANLSTAALTLKPLPKGTISTATPNVCTGSNISLIYTATSGAGPFQLTVNGNVYNNVVSGVAFNTGIIATAATTLSLTTVTDNGGCSITKATPITFNVFSCGPLPVELLSFDVTARQNDALLDWSTSTEINNKGFDVQRSKDATNWETIGFINGIGQSSAVNHYQYRDKGLAAGRYFYRLVQIDFNDKKTISAIKSITLNGQLDFDLKQNYPNPFNQSTVIEFTIPTRQNVLIGIYDIKGRLIQTLVNETRQKGTYTIQFNRKELSAGMYYLKMETFEYKAVRKFVIE